MSVQRTCVLIPVHSQFGRGEAPERLGTSRDYNIDLVPKFLMSGGECDNLVGCVINSHQLYI